MGRNTEQRKPRTRQGQRRGAWQQIVTGNRRPGRRPNGPVRVEELVRRDRQEADRQLHQAQRPVGAFAFEDQGVAGREFVLV
ncbi:hypothetical protein [Arthrobacter celericrescens]|uniref:hypothetical protein n=1 Tax=Arthrobacter celericrescens TaxID=2320851 RepID=UPI001FDFE7A9|nr:hypothetical protein [Arthrobacter celericrescens]